MSFHPVRGNQTLTHGGEIKTLAPGPRKGSVPPGWRGSILAATLLVTVALSFGCTSIISLNIPQETVVGPPYVITLQMRPESNLADARGVFAFRYPSRWEVLSVTYQGSHLGDAHRSHNMVDYFKNNWESHAEDDRHNGDLPNSEWWAGYSDVHNWESDDFIFVTVTFDTHRLAGNAHLDFVTGLTSADDPDDPANPGDKLYWEGGDVRLNEMALLYTFSDVNQNSPYYLAIETLALEAVVAGYIDPATQIAEFRPRNPVWRAQFAKMMVTTLGLEVPANLQPPFTDLGPDDPNNFYPHQFVARIAQAGITLGKTPTTFAPWDDISRAQVVTMVVRAAQQAGVALEAPPAGYQGSWGSIPTHGANARLAEWNELLMGLPLAGAASDPWADMPRGEVAQVLANLMRKLP